MTTKYNVELRFINYSIENYLNIFSELLDNGKKHFLIRGVNQDTLEFLKRAKNIENTTFNFYASFDCRDILCSGEIYSEFEINDIEAIFVFITDTNKLSSALMDYIKLKNCIVVAPVTENYSKNRSIFVICPPKAGGHMLLKIIQDFGFFGPGDINSIKRDGSFYFLNNKDQHTEITYLSAFHAPSKHIEAFFSQPCLFLYRDPRDIAVSLFHFLAKPPDQFLSRHNVPSLYHALQPYFMSLRSDHERLMKVICGAPVIFSIRDFVMPFAGWLEMPNVIPIRFEDLVGPNGGGSFDSQFETILKLQLALHVSGKTIDFASKAFNKESPTFRKGEIGSYLDEFTEEHIILFKSLPQDFMEIYGYKTEIELVEPFILWFTGLPCSGKTTLAQCLEKEFLFDSSTHLTVLDGDVLRRTLSKDLGFSKEDRNLHNLRVAVKASEISKEGFPVLVALISPNRDTRNKIRQNYSNVVEVYVKCPLEVCEKRDVKGMYRLARDGKIPNFTGIDDPYEEPLNPDIVVETNKNGIKSCVDFILDGLVKLGYIHILKSSVKEKTQHYFSSSMSNEGPDPVLIEEGYKGFNIVSYKGKYFCLAQDLGPVDLINVEDSAMNEYKNHHKCFIGNSVFEVKNSLDKISH